MPRTEQSAVWPKQNRPPAPREISEDDEAADLADLYGPRCAVVSPDTFDLERPLFGGVPLSFLTNMTFASPARA